MTSALTTGFTPASSATSLPHIYIYVYIYIYKYVISNKESLKKRMYKQIN